MHKQSHQKTHPTFTYRKGLPPLNWALWKSPAGFEGGASNCSSLRVARKAGSFEDAFFETTPRPSTAASLDRKDRLLSDMVKSSCGSPHKFSPKPNLCQELPKQLLGLPPLPPNLAD